MKPGDLKNPIKMRNRLNVTDVYYTFPHWKTREIDGVVFLPVVKQPPSHERTQTLHYIRKDSLEKTK
jgi:hypothetical protein